MSVELLILAVTAFVATDIDDFVLLAALFGSRTLKSKNIVIGQLVGIGTLVLVSSVAALAALSIPPGWANLLGVLPLALGIRGAITWFRPAEKETAETPMVLPSVFGRSEIVSVACLTVASGGDNLAIYIPLFSSSPAVIPLYAAVFALMTVLWCALGRLLVSYRRAAGWIERYSQVLVPVVLFGLGLHILSGAFALL
jgi:cadmium resistance protein CadD (predicted permease)